MVPIWRPSRCARAMATPTSSHASAETMHQARTDVSSLIGQLQTADDRVAHGGDGCCVRVPVRLDDPMLIPGDHVRRKTGDELLEGMGPEARRLLHACPGQMLLRQ